MTVTIIPADRFYYVTGEVKKPGPEPYLGETDIIKAISAALDFTDFGNKHKVRLTRANGQTQVINVQRILDDPQYDVPVYPGDKIYVPRRLF
jgi:protein involved in polysaccharide export with SLBB domain